MAVLTTTEKLADARDKYHKLNTGSLREVVRDGDTTIEFTKANASKLAAYIEELESQLANEQGSTVKRRAPAGVIF